MPVARVLADQSKTSWWLGLDRQKFQQQAREHAARIRTLNYAPPTAFQPDYRSPMTKARQKAKIEVADE